MLWQVVSVKKRAADAAIVRLIEYANAENDPQRAPEAARRGAIEYATNDACGLWAIEHDGVVIGIIGVRNEGDRRFTLTDLAVTPEAQRQGLGQRLIEFVLAEVDPRAIRGHTSFRSAEFYRRCGFSVREDGLTRAGEPKHLFEWNASEPAALAAPAPKEEP
jgi:GNAT superfamily N-acetyltransferase